MAKLLATFALVGAAHVAFAGKDEPKDPSDEPQAFEFVYCDDYLLNKAREAAHRDAEKVRSQITKAWERGFGSTNLNQKEDSTETESRAFAAGKKLSRSSAATAEDAVKIFYELFEESDEHLASLIQMEVYRILNKRPECKASFERSLFNLDLKPIALTHALRVGASFSHPKPTLLNPEILLKATEQLSKNSPRELKQAVVFTLAQLAEVHEFSGAKTVQERLGILAHNSDWQVARSAFFTLSKDIIFGTGWSLPKRPKRPKQPMQPEQPGSKKKSSPSKSTDGWYKFEINPKGPIDDGFVHYHRGIKGEDPDFEKWLLPEEAPKQNETDSASASLHGQIWRIALEETELPVRIWATRALLQVDREIGHETAKTLLHELIMENAAWAKFSLTLPKSIFGKNTMDEESFESTLIGFALGILDDPNGRDLKQISRTFIQNSRTLSPSVKDDLLQTYLNEANDSESDDETD